MEYAVASMIKYSSALSKPTKSEGHGDGFTRGVSVLDRA